MKGSGHVATTLMLAALTGLAGCGGGSGNNGSSSPALSADQQVFEQFTLSPAAAYTLDWQLPLTGTPTTAHYLTQTHASIATSPSNGAAKDMSGSAAVSLAATLAAPGTPSVTRYLINGQIVVGSSTLKRASYFGQTVRIDDLSSDGNTIVESRLRHDLAIVPLSGTVASAPAELSHYLNSLYYNPALLNTSATWQSGAAYLRFGQIELSDCYTVIDYAAATTGAVPSPVASNTTIAALMQAGGIYSSADSKTYVSTDGAVTTVNGVRTFVATSARPNLTTLEYRTYYELNGNVYDGSLIKAGTDVGGNIYPVAAPQTTSGYVLNYSQNYRVLLNEAATNSLKAALTF